MFDWDFTVAEAVRYLVAMLCVAVAMVVGVALFGFRSTDLRGPSALIVLLPAPIDIVVSFQLAASRVERHPSVPGFATFEPPLATMLRAGLLTNALMFGLGIPAAIHSVRRSRA